MVRAGAAFACRNTRSLGFVAADVSELARVLADTHQVRTFVATGQITREVAWTRVLGGA